jgi:glycosyltransferase involved in cell wall biosynthesis
MNTSEKSVSVLIPVFNVENYIGAALKSISEQTYKNLEIVVVDDGSSDRTLDVVQECRLADPRIVVLQNEKNRGIVASLNRALSVASGEYIARMDGDDISEQDRIEKQVRFLEGNPDYDLVGVSLRSIDGNGAFVSQLKMHSDFGKIVKALKYDSPVAHVWVCNKELYSVVGPYRNFPGCEDYDFLLRVISSGRKITNLEDYYGYYVRIGRHGNTISTVGLRQWRAKEYAYRLYVNRCLHRQEDFTSDGLDKALSCSPLRELMYQKSSRFIHLAVKSRGHLFRMCFYLAVSCALYPPQVRHLFNRVMMRI